VDISIVVCTHNRARLLRTALRHLVAQDFEGVAAELIVVDNRSTDDTAEVVREFAAA
jgi:glycosyltransferase involved in cell wall biosynthesis